jgi:hypothetical protein
MLLNDHFQDFVADPERRRIYEREALAFDASELISELMEKQDVSKSKLAHLAGTSKSHVTQLLSGSRNMTMHTLADLAFVLGHKVEIKAAPLSAAACWFNDYERNAYMQGWEVHVGGPVYKPKNMAGKSLPALQAPALDDCLSPVA